jgi:uncharacterized DUF497 family protein
MKHGVRFADAALSFEDPLWLSIADIDASGDRHVISRKAARAEQRAYEANI